MPGLKPRPTYPLCPGPADRLRQGYGESAEAIAKAEAGPYAGAEAPAYLVVASSGARVRARASSDGSSLTSPNRNQRSSCVMVAPGSTRDI